MTKRILVPISDSGHSVVTPLVRGIARDQGSTVRLLRVMPVPENVVTPAGRTVAYVDQQMERLTAQGLAELDEATVNEALGDVRTSLLEADVGYDVVQDKVHVHDLHATMLHLLGFDHEKLTYRYNGRDFRLTDVFGNVVHDLIA